MKFKKDDDVTIRAKIYNPMNSDGKIVVSIDPIVDGFPVRPIVLNKDATPTLTHRENMTLDDMEESFWFKQRDGCCFFNIAEKRYNNDLTRKVDKGGPDMDVMKVWRNEKSYRAGDPPIWERKEPKYKAGDIVLVDKWNYGFSWLERPFHGEIVGQNPEGFYVRVEGFGGGPLFFRHKYILGHYTEPETVTVEMPKADFENAPEKKNWKLK
jgi:hypothetical protein